MTRVRVLTLSLLTFALVPGLSFLGCTPETGGGTNVERTGGTGGGGSGGSGGRGGSGTGTGGSSSSTGGTGGSSSGTGGSGSSTGGTGGTGTGGTGGSTGGTGGSSSGTGGSAGSAGSGGTGGGGSGGSSVDAPAPVDGMSAVDSGGGEGGALSLGEPFPARAWIRLCPKAWDKTQCCQMLCACLPDLCSDSPADKARFGGCMSMCMGLSDQRARCQVYHCYESKNPGAVKDHASHCGHASGRVGGGGCDILNQQK